MFALVVSLKQVGPVAQEHGGVSGVLQILQPVDPAVHQCCLATVLQCAVKRLTCLLLPLLLLLR